MVIMAKDRTYNPLTPKRALLLAAPHTWVAAVYPVLIAFCLATRALCQVSYLMAVVLLAISILLQSSVNAINDYFDFIKGSDSSQDPLEADDAVLVYDHIDPRSVKWLSIGFMVTAFLLGIYVIVFAGFIPLLIALVGAVVVFLYSGGRTPISYLPIGELVSGTVMGGLITFASYYALTEQVHWTVFAFALPAILGIALIMLTNNISDIEKDADVGRRTLSVLLGRDRSRILYRLLLWAWVLCILVIVIRCFQSAIVIPIFGLVIAYPILRRLLTASFAPAERIGNMAQICNLNIVLNTFYCMSIVM